MGALGGPPRTIFPVRIHNTAPKQAPPSPARQPQGWRCAQGAVHSAVIFGGRPRRCPMNGHGRGCVLGRPSPYGSKPEDSFSERESPNGLLARASRRVAKGAERDDRSRSASASMQRLTTGRGPVLRRLKTDKDRIEVTSPLGRQPKPARCGAIHKPPPARAGDSQSPTKRIARPPSVFF